MKVHEGPHLNVQAESCISSRFLKAASRFRRFSSGVRTDSFLSFVRARYAIIFAPEPLEAPDIDKVPSP
jgi:hypothetical protein